MTITRRSHQKVVITQSYIPIEFHNMFRKETTFLNIHKIWRDSSRTHFSKSSHHQISARVWWSLVKNPSEIGTIERFWKATLKNQKEAVLAAVIHQIIKENWGRDIAYWVMELQMLMNKHLSSFSQTDQIIQRIRWLQKFYQRSQYAQYHWATTRQHFLVQ